MDILGDRRFVEVPGCDTYELPPLLVHASPKVKRLDRVMDMANGIVDSEDMLADPLAGDEQVQRRRMDLALNLVDQYFELVTQWQWGDSILEWIRQCEMTFDSRPDLRNIMRNDVWPHAGRCSFVQLLSDKAVAPTANVPLERAVGLRLTFRQRPPMSILSDQFFFYLQPKMASTAYETWSHLSTPPIASLPPERFSFQVVDMSIQ